MKCPTAFWLLLFLTVKMNEDAIEGFLYDSRILVLLRDDPLLHKRSMAPSTRLEDPNSQKERGKRRERVWQCS